jgi:hypothetical protein
VRSLRHSGKVANQQAESSAAAASDTDQAAFELGNGRT